MVLTTRQAEVLNFVRKFQREHGYTPTRVDIARHFGFWPNAAEDHLKALQRKGAIRLEPQTARGICIL